MLARSAAGSHYGQELLRPVAVSTTPPQEYLHFSQTTAAMATEAEKVEHAESEQDEEEDVYEVERIIDMRLEEVS